MGRLLLSVVCVVLFLTALGAVTEEVKEERDRHGATNRLRHGAGEKTVYFIFTADSMFEGGDYALDVLKEKDVKASFFVTGNFLRDSVRNAPVLTRITGESHYLGSHGDRHILLADWDASRSVLATPDSAVRDMDDCQELLKAYVPDIKKHKYVVPPFEWYNATHISAYRQAGYIPLSICPGVLTYADYTTPDMEQYVSSDSIWSNFVDNLENADLDGRFILLHLGTDDTRTDKFYYRLGEMIDSLQSHGYRPAGL